MKYMVEESLRDFKAWSGGKDTLDDLLEYDVLDEAEEYINIVTADNTELPTDTEINDILWFERDEIYKYCGIYDAVYNTSDKDSTAE